MVVGVALLAAAGPPTVADQAQPAATEPPEKQALTGLDDPFFSYSRPADYDVVQEDVTVPTRDGSHLACQLYRPADPTSGELAEGTFPGLVYEYTAYAENAEDFGLGASYFVERGYNALVCQVRGSGASPGDIDPFSGQEQEDNYDVIEWLAAHPASTGDIGQMGVSYGGHSTLLVAVEQPPHLRAIIPVNGIHDWYENTIYRGGIASARIRDWQRSVAPETLVTYPEHPLYDDFWAERSVMARWDRLTIPTLEINGWYDRYRDGMVKNYQAQPDHVWLVSGPWEHGSPQEQFEGVQPGAYLAWWDHWLAGDEQVPLPAARVTSYEIPGPGEGTGWAQFDQWPPAESRSVTLALREDGSLGQAAGPADTADFLVNTEPRSPWADEQVLFSTPPLRHDLVLAGSPSVNIRGSFSAEDGNIATVLYDEAPDGSRSRVTEGWLKASHRDGHDHVVPVESGEMYPMNVHLWPTHYRLAEGHRLVLRVSSDDYPEIDAEAPAGTVSIETGARGATLEIQALPGHGRIG